MEGSIQEEGEGGQAGIRRNDEQYPLQAVKKNLQWYVPGQ